MKKPKNFARFYALLHQMPGPKDGLKESLVASFTNQRTTSLHDMNLAEYKAMCNSMASEIYKEKPGQVDLILKSYRSAVLTRLQKLGIDTTDWGKVDEFCKQSRIAGKNFRELTQEELLELVPKLEAIARKQREKTEFRKAKPVQPPAPALELIPDWQLRLMLGNMDNSILN